MVSLLLDMASINDSKVSEGAVGQRILRHPKEIVCAAVESLFRVWVGDGDRAKGMISAWRSCEAELVSKQALPTVKQLRLFLLHIPASRPASKPSC